MRSIYINEMQAEIDDKTNIALSYKSPMFSDLQSISANTSYTIKLPLTAYNRGLIDNINIVGVESDFGYDYFKATYVVDGIEVIRDGVGYLLSTSDCIEICILFGGIANFSNLKDAKLNEMPIPIEEGLIDWTGGHFADMGNAGDIMFLYAEYGAGTEGQLQYAHPSVRVSKIWEWINRAYGLKLEQVNNDWVIPCVTKKARDGHHKATVYDKAYGGLITQQWRVNTLSPMSQGSLVFSMSGTDDDARMYVQTDVRATVTASCNMTKDGIWQFVIISKFGVEAVDGETEWYEWGGDVESTLTVDFKAGVEYRLYFMTEGWLGWTMDMLNYRLMVDGDLVYGEKFDALYNLPKMKVVDFIKAIMQMNGVFPMLKDNGNIGFSSVDDVYANMSDAKDWSDKLVEISSVTFRFLNFTQNNEFLWTEDDSVIFRDGAVLVVDNKTIATKSECVKLPFAASDDTNADDDIYARAIIPLYSRVENKDGTVEYEFHDIKPRVMKIMPGMRGLIMGRFDASMRLGGPKGIVAQKYSKYAEVIRKPKVVKCRMRLTPADLAGLDFVVPVYVEQAGGMFAVLSVSTRDDFADVELLRLT